MYDFSNFMMILLDRIVLVVGGGPSGIDLTNALAAKATKVIFSHHTHDVGYELPSNVVKKGKISRFTNSGVVFTDGSEDAVTDILLCTGMGRFCEPFTLLFYMI